MHLNGTTWCRFPTVIIILACFAFVRCSPADINISCQHLRAEVLCEAHSEYDCHWNADINQCLCKPHNHDTQIIAITPSSQTLLTKALSSIIPCVSTIDAAISIFRLHRNTNKPRIIQNMLIIFHEHTAAVTTNASVLPSSQRAILHSLNVDVKFASYKDTALLADLLCDIYHHQQVLSSPSRKLLSLQSSYDQLCCHCLTVSSESGCSGDPLCEAHVCDTDRLCCDDDGFGWDDLCVSVASDLCTNDLDDRHSYDSCWQIERQHECNHAYYTQQLGCYWDDYDDSCMCKMHDDSVELVYLMDISDASGNAQHFENVGHLLDDVQMSTLYHNSDYHANYILYDESDYELGPLHDVTLVNIDVFPRKALVNVTNAIYAAIKYFRALRTDKQKILVITNAQNERYYEDEEAVFCSLRNVLQEQRISVITLSYTLDDDDTPLDLGCIADISNTVSYSAIAHAAGSSEWDVFPIEAKLSSDICQLSQSVPVPATPSPTPKPPTLKRTSSPTPRPSIIATTTTTIAASMVAAPIPTPNPTPEPSPSPTSRPTISLSTTIESTAASSFDDETACDLQANFEFVILADASCGVSGDNCLSQLQMIGALLSSLKQDNDIAHNPLVSYIEYSQSSAQVLVSLNDQPMQESVDTFIEKIETDGSCSRRGNTYPLKTDLVSGLELAMHELLNNGTPGHSVQKIITINNCQNTQRPEELCGDVLNELYLHEISVYAINIAAAGAFHRHNVITNPQHYPLCEQIRHVCSASYAWYHVDRDTVMDAIQQCLLPICSVPASPVLSPNLNGPEFTDKSAAESTGNPTSKPTVHPTQSTPTVEPTPEPTPRPTDTPTLQPTLRPTEKPTFTTSVSPTDAPSVDRKCNMDETNWNLQFVARSRTITADVVSVADLSSSSSSSSSEESGEGKLDISKQPLFDVVYGDETGNERNRRILAYCYEYVLDIADSTDNKCFGDASDIRSWMIEMPGKCGPSNDAVSDALKDVLYLDYPNDVDLMYSAAGNAVGFGKMYSSARDEIKPDIGSKTTFSVCFKSNDKLNYNLMTKSGYSIDGENGYSATGESVDIVDLCSLFEPANGNNKHDDDEVRTGWDG